MLNLGNTTTQVFLVRPDSGRATVSLNSGTFRNATDFAWSPDSQWLAYVAPEDIGGAAELYAYAPANGQRRKLSTPAASSNEDVIGGIAWSPDGTHLAYLADRDPTPTGVFDLFTVVPALLICLTVMAGLALARSKLRG